MTVVLVVVAFIWGLVLGALLVARNTHRLVARLPQADQIAFARKVNARRSRS